MEPVDVIKERAEAIKEFLTNEGFRPEIEGSDVKLKYEGERLWVIQDEKDLEYVRVMFFNFWPIESAKERLAVYEAASEVTSGTKGASICVADDDVSSSVDLLVGSTEALLKVLPRALEVCGVGAHRFRDAVPRILARMEAEADDSGPETPKPPAVD